ncbi:hypothetical protein EL75_4978 [Escherichia coli]|nr:hypothetical protein EL75_4978 [Escherichia coli]
MITTCSGELRYEKRSRKGDVELQNLGYPMDLQFPAEKGCLRDFA